MTHSSSSEDAIVAKSIFELLDVGRVVHVLTRADALDEVSTSDGSRICFVGQENVRRIKLSPFYPPTLEVVDHGANKHSLTVPAWVVKELRACIKANDYGCTLKIQQTGNKKSVLACTRIQTVQNAALSEEAARLKAFEALARERKKMAKAASHQPAPPPSHPRPAIAVENKRLLRMQPKPVDPLPPLPVLDDQPDYDVPEITATMPPVKVRGKKLERFDRDEMRERRYN